MYLFCNKYIYAFPISKNVSQFDSSLNEIYKYVQLHIESYYILEKGSLFFPFSKNVNEYFCSKVNR